jgi:hypothetical protein
VHDNSWQGGVHRLPRIFSQNPPTARGAPGGAPGCTHVSSLCAQPRTAQECWRHPGAAAPKPGKRVSPLKRQESMGARRTHVLGARALRPAAPRPGDHPLGFAVRWCLGASKTTLLRICPRTRLERPGARPQQATAAPVLACGIRGCRAAAGRPQGQVRCRAGERAVAAGRWGRGWARHAPPAPTVRRN